MVERAEACPPEKTILPRLLTVNSVVPLAEAVIRSPEFLLFTMRAALLPMPALMYSGASGVAETAEPIWTPELLSDERRILPDPAAVKVRLLFEPFVMV